MKYYAIIRKLTNSMYTVFFPDLDGCVTQGKNYKEAIERAKEALSLWIKAADDLKLERVSPSTYKELREVYKDKYITISPFDLEEDSDNQK